MYNFDKKKFGLREIELGKSILEKNPTDTVQRDRVSYWALQLGDIDTAIEYGTSEKMIGMLRERNIQLPS